MAIPVTLSGIGVTPPPLSTDLVDPRAVKFTINPATGLPSIVPGSMVAAPPWLIWFNSQFVGSEVTDDTALLEALDEGAGANDAQALARESQTQQALDEGAGLAEAQKATRLAQAALLRQALSPEPVNFANKLRELESSIALLNNPKDYDAAIRSLQKSIELTQSLVPETFKVTESQIIGAEWLIDIGGSANAITANTTTQYFVLQTGTVVRLVPTSSNTATVTLAVNGITPGPVVKNDGVALLASDIQANQAYLLLWTGSAWQIIGAIVTSALLAPLPSGDFWVGNSSNVATAVAMSGDATLDNTAKLTLDTVNPDVGTFGDATHTVTVTANAKGLITSITVNGITITSAQIIAALGYTPATSGANSTFTLVANLVTGAVTGTITQV